MKTRTRTKVPSTIRPTHAFTTREREAYINWQKPDSDAPLGWVTSHEGYTIAAQVVKEADLDLSPHAREAVAELSKRLKVGKMYSPLLLAATFAASMVIDDNAETMDATREKLEEVLDAVETCWSDPEPPESWVVNTTAEGDGSIDIVKFLNHIRRVTAEVLARRGAEPETLDEKYRLAFNLGGRDNADHVLDVLRSKGALGTLRVTKGITHVVDRSGYERLMRGLSRPYYCHDPYCEGESEHFSWDKLEEMDCTEDGAVAVVVRRQERRDGSWVTAIAVCGKPTGITERLAKIDEERQYVVVESEVAP